MSGERKKNRGNTSSQNTCFSYQAISFSVTISSHYAKIQREATVKSNRKKNITIEHLLLIWKVPEHKLCNYHFDHTKQDIHSVRSRKHHFNHKHHWKSGCNNSLPEGSCKNHRNNTPRLQNKSSKESTWITVARHNVTAAPWTKYCCIYAEVLSTKCSAMITHEVLKYFSKSKHW